MRTDTAAPRLKVLVIGLILIWHGVYAVSLAWAGSGSPEWIAGESSKYPKERYLTGVGYGESRKVAEDEAYAAISKIFQVNIQSQARELEEYSQFFGTRKDSEGEPQIHRKVFIDQLTQVSTDKVLENVSIAEVWVDPKAQKTYALAVMNRAHASAVIRGRIAELDQQAQMMFRSATEAMPSDRSGQETHKLQMVRHLYAAFKALLMREGLNTDLKIISPDGHGIDSPLSLAQLEGALQEALTQEFLVALHLSGPYSEKIWSAVVQGLTREGLVVLDSSEPGGEQEKRPGDVLVEGELVLASLQLQGRPFFRWNVEFTLIDQVSGQVFGSVTRSGREGHFNPGEAEARAVRAAQRVVQEEVAPALVSMILGGDRTIKNTEVP